MNKIRIVQIIIAACVIILIGIFASKLNNNYSNYVLKAQVIDDYGTWHIELNDEVELEDMRSYVNVYDNELKDVDIEVSRNEISRNQFTIRPVHEYEVNKWYRLIIRNIKEDNNVHINSEFSQGFNVNMKPLEVVGYKIMNTKFDISVKFNQEVRIDDRITDYIKILSEDGISLAINVFKDSDDKKGIIIKIHESLIPGNQYRIKIRGNIQSVYENILLESFSDEFKVNKIKLDKKLGLGVYESKRVINDREYQWYASQDNSGEFANNNSGPAIAVMIAKWKNKSEKIDIKRARDIYYPQGDDWFIVTLMSFFEEFDIDSIIEDSISSFRMKKELDNGNILVAYIDPEKISYQENVEAVVGRFTKETIPHYIVVKGYVVVDGKLFFQVYDPYNEGKTNIYGEFMGKDRYYEEQEVMQAIKATWDKTVIIKK